MHSMRYWSLLSWSVARNSPCSTYVASVVQPINRCESSAWSPGTIAVVFVGFDFLHASASAKVVNFALKKGVTFVRVVFVCVVLALITRLT